MADPAQDRDAAFRGFVAASQRRLVHFAELLTADRARAEDLVQDAYVKTYAAWKRIQPGAAEAYARRCLINARTDWWRRRRAHELPVVIEPDAMVASDGSGEVDQRMIVLAALSRLTARERTVIALRYYIGLTEADIAAELGIAVGTVKSTSSRAVAKLRADQSLREGVAR